MLSLCGNWGLLSERSLFHSSYTDKSIPSMTLRSSCFQVPDGQTWRSAGPARHCVGPSLGNALHVRRRMHACSPCILPQSDHYMLSPVHGRCTVRASDFQCKNSPLFLGNHSVVQIVCFGSILFAQICPDKVAQQICEDDDCGYDACHLPARAAWLVLLRLLNVMPSCADLLTRRLLGSASSWARAALVLSTRGETHRTWSPAQHRRLCIPPSCSILCDG